MTGVKLFLADRFRPLSDFIKGKMRILFWDKYFYARVILLVFNFSSYKSAIFIRFAEISYNIMSVIQIAVGSRIVKHYPVYIRQGRASNNNCLT